MPAPKKNWNVVTPSQYAWEQEALDFVHQRFPANDAYHAWSNFEFVAENGSIYEVDLLVMGPWGVFMIEIKSKPGTISGRGNTWSRTHEGRSTTDENPRFLVNRKAKALAGLLSQQKKALRGAEVPFIEALVFCSHPTNQLLLTGNDAIGICVRDRDPERDGEQRNDATPGIVGAVNRRACPGLRPYTKPPVSEPQRRAFLRAMETCGIRPRQSARRAGDYKLEELFLDSPTGSYQDWLGSHRTLDKSTRRLIRLYLEHRQSTSQERETIRRAAEREFHILDRLDHPGILRVETLSSTDSGHALIFKFDEGCQRLDRYLDDHNEAFGLAERLDLLRQIVDAVAYAHRRRVVHRALSPQSILVFEDENGSPRIRIYNWQVGLVTTDTSTGSRVSRSLHADQLVEDASTAYVAPEAISGQNVEGTELDSFSLGAIAFFILSGQPPASGSIELGERLAASNGALDLCSVANGVHPDLVDLIKFSANVNRSLRFTAEDFLEQLDAFEEKITEPDQEALVDPRDANPNDRLPHGLIVKRKLGSGSVSCVLLVKKADDDDDSEIVLKVASRPDHNEKIRQEYDTLRKLRHPSIVEAFDFLEFGDLHGFTMAKAGDETLAKRLKREGTLSIDYLERFGEELILALDYLDKQGVAHRDIKPDNLGVGSVANGPLQLVLFDFSLSNSPADQVHLGTPPYLDPFIERRTTAKRWDAYAERFSAAMTLYEMATGVLPRWGTDESAPHLIGDEVTIQAELFPADLRPGMVDFFACALARDYTNRFDNAELMRNAWRDVFRNVDQPAVRPASHDAEREEREAAVDREALLATATPDTQLILLGLSARLINALDRIHLSTVADLLAYPLIRIYRMRGVGNKTRNELADLVHQLRRRFPKSPTPQDEENLAAAIEDEGEVASEVVSVDLLAKKLALVSDGRETGREKEILKAFFGLTKSEPDPRALAWPSQSQFAESTDVTRARIGEIVTRARDRWLNVPAITSLRASIHEILAVQSGVMTHEELIASVLHLRGSSLPDDDRFRMASVVTRAAVEAEKQLVAPHFHEVRRQGKIFVTITNALAEYAWKLGQQADQLVAQETLPTAAGVIEALQAVRRPTDAESSRFTFDHKRLVHLAAAASQHACVNAKLELYPRGLEARRALALAQGVLFGVEELSVESIRQRVASRFREAEPLPDRPELDELLQDVGFPLVWSSNVNDATGAYVTPRTGDAILSTATPTFQKTKTHDFRRARRQVPPDIAAAQRLDEKLRYAQQWGSFLVLAVPSRQLPSATEALTSRFEADHVDADRLILGALKDEAEQLNVKWDVVLAADAAEAGSRDWERLQILVGKAMPAVFGRLKAARKSVVLTNPGLFARYEQMDRFQEIRTTVGTAEGPHGLWMLIPSHGPDSRPVIGTQAIPITNPAQFEIVPEAWIRGRFAGG